MLRIHHAPARDILLLLAILALATGVRLYRLNAQSFWVDEFATSQLALGRGYAHHKLPRNVVLEHPPDLFDLKTATPLHKLWYSETDGHVPPMYLLVTRLWGGPFGLGQASMRMLSVVCSLAAIVLLFVIVRDLSDATTALGAALLMALAGPQIQYAQEARNYTLLLLEGLGAAAALVRIDKYGPSRGRAIVLLACVLTMALTHYFSLGAIVALAVYAAVRLRGRALTHAAACFVVAGILWALLGAPLAIRQLQNRDDPRATSFLRDDAPGHATRTLTRLAALPVRYIAEPMTTSKFIATAGGVAFVLALLLPIRRREMLLWSLWLWLSILPIAALDLARGTRHLEFVRYTLLASPALYAIVASLLAERRDWLRHLAPATVALACVLALPYAYEVWLKPDWRALGRAIDANVREGEVVVFFGSDKSGDFSSDPNATFYYTSFYRRKPLGPVVLMDEPPAEAVAQRLRESKGLLVVAPRGMPLAEIVPGATFRQLAFEAGAAALWRVELP
jgi:uncharacterized membrane protein